MGDTFYLLFLYSCTKWLGLSLYSHRSLDGNALFSKSRAHMWFYEIHSMVASCQCAHQHHLHRDDVFSESCCGSSLQNYSNSRVVWFDYSLPHTTLAREPNRIHKLLGFSANPKPVVPNWLCGFLLVVKYAASF